MSSEYTAETRKVPMSRFPGIRATVAGMIQAGVGYWGPWYGWTVTARFLREQMGFSSTDIGVAGTIGRVAAIAAGPAGGWAIDNLGPRYSAIIMQGLLGLAGIMLATVTQVWHMHIWYSLFYFFMTAGLYPLIFPAINRWWMDRRAFMLAIVTLGGGSSGIWGPPAIAVLADSYGWQAMCVVVGVITVVVSVAVAFLYPHRMPEHYGLYVDNLSPEERRERAELAAARRGQRPVVRPPLADVTLRQALRSFAFWMITLSAVAAAFAGAPVSLFQNIRMGAVGYSPMEAAVFYSARTTFSYVGRCTVMIFGDWFSEHFSPRFLVTLCYALEAIGYIFFALGSSATFFWLWAAVDGIGFGALMPAVPVLFGAYFGRQAFGVIYGLRTGLSQIGAAIAPVFVGWLSEVQRGDWTLPFITVVVGYALAAALVVVAIPPKEQARERR